MKKANLIYFSATGTTRTIIEAIAEGCGVENIEHHTLLRQPPKHVPISKNELTIFAVPVYSGRVPSVAAQRIKSFVGEKSPAIIAVIYGNREFDDALIELRDIVTECGFMVASAGAFVAQHSIFPKVGAMRPNSNDLALAKEFGAKSTMLSFDGQIDVPGNPNYKAVSNIPLQPKTSKKLCDMCGACVTACPTGAISKGKLKIDKKLCIKCAHCITICPQRARSFGGLLYKIAGRSFEKKNAMPKSAQLFYNM